MDVTNRFVLDFAVRFAARHPGARILDYGCGAGDLVAAGRAAGLNIVGADVFYGGSQARAEAERLGRLGSLIFEIRDDRAPFDDSSFDLVTNNQVLEHVEDLKQTVSEIDRLLKPGGTVLSIFPSAEVIREGHIGIPCAHWFRKDSRLRFYYTWALRRLGLGTWKQQAPSCRQWALDKLRWIDDYTYYRPQREILTVFGRHFRNELREPDYIRFRLRDTWWLAPLARLLDLPGGEPAAVALFRRLAFMVIVSHKDTECA